MLQIVCQAAPDKPNRPNEDTFVAVQRNDMQPAYILAAIDGATTLVEFAPLKQYLDEQRNGITPAALAASVARDAILSQISIGESDPTELMLGANEALRVLLETITPAIFDAEAMLDLEPSLKIVLDDPRKIRLFLPSAVITLVTINTETNMLHYAHAGDTMLLLGYIDGHVYIPTEHHRQPHSLQAAQIMSQDKNLMMDDALNHPTIKTLDLNARIYHNYVNEDGTIDLNVGVGVIDGLPELADYLQSGEISLQDVDIVAITSDGFIFPTPLHETTEEKLQRYVVMAQQWREFGALHYLNALRHEESADRNREKYPRFKLHDDATGILYFHDLKGA